jgi:hypothetical protein
MRSFPAPTSDNDLCDLFFFHFYSFQIKYPGGAQPFQREIDLNFQYSLAIDIPNSDTLDFGPQAWPNRVCRMILPGSNTAGCAGRDLK